MSIHLIQQGVREGAHTAMLNADTVINYSIVDQDGEPVDIASPAVAELRLHASNNRFVTPSAYKDLTIVDGPSGAGTVSFDERNADALAAQTYWGWLYHTAAGVGVASAELVTNSVSMTVHPIITVTGRHGSGAVLDVNLAAASVPSIAVAGTGYVVDDILTHNDVGGSVVGGDLATFRVNTVGGSGEITSISVENDGEYSGIVAGDSTANAVTGGTGSGATLDILWTALAASLTVTTAGSGYVDDPTVTTDAAGLTLSAQIGDVTRLITESPVQITFQ